MASLYVNFENAIKAASGVTSISHPKNETTLSSQSAFKLNLTNKLTKFKLWKQALIAH